MESESLEERLDEAKKRKGKTMIQIEDGGNNKLLDVKEIKGISTELRYDEKDNTPKHCLIISLQSYPYEDILKYDSQHQLTSAFIDLKDRLEDHISFI